MLSKRNNKRKTIDAYGKLMRFPLLFMRIIGLYHHKSDSFLLKLYSIIIISCMWCFFIKTIIVIEKKDLNSGQLAVKLVFLTCMLSTSANATLIYVNQESENKEKYLIKQYNNLLKITENGHLIKKRLSIRLIILFIIAIILVLLNCIISSFGLFKKNYLNKAYSVILAPYNDDTLAYKIFMAVLHYYLLFLWVITSTYFITHCLFIIELTQDFNEQFKRLIKEKIFIPDNVSNYDLIDQDKSLKIDSLDVILMEAYEDRTIATEHEFEYFRSWHSKLCECIKTLDKCYTFLIGVTIVLYMPLGLFALFALIDHKKTHINDHIRSLLLFWFGIGYMMFMLVLGCAAKVHNTVYFSYIFQILFFNFFK
jgi:hypothetical protein